jgi:nucleotide-binding universal stress UspA family protein
MLMVAEKLNASMIVVGTQGAHGVGGDRIGSVARKLLRRVDRPILTVSRMAGVAPAEVGGTFESIVYPTDLSDSSRAGVRAARIVAERTGARLTLVHVIRLPSVIPALPGEAPVVIPRAATGNLELRRRAELEELAAAVGETNVESRLAIDDDPAHAICGIANQSGHDLIVMPRHGRHSMASYVFGHTAENVAKLAPVPVLLFNPRVP